MLELSADKFLNKTGLLTVDTRIIKVFIIPLFCQLGAQWLSGRVLDSRPRGCGFEPHLRHCVVVLEQDTFILA